MLRSRIVALCFVLSLFLGVYHVFAPSATGPAAKAFGVQALAAAKKEQKVIATVALPGVQVETLNPYAHSTTQIYPTWKHVIEPLVEWNWKKKQIVPILAASWSNPDKNTWVFKLKKGIKFHDGSEFTSADVVHSFTRIQKDIDSKQASSIAHVDAIEAVDPYTVRLHTKTPDAALLFRLAQRFITNKAAYDRLGPAAADKLALGTGPYKLKDWVRGQWFVLEKNPGYTHSDHKPTVDEIVFRSIPEAEVAITSLLNREVDIISNVPPESAGRVTGRARIESTRTINIMFLGMHTSVPQFRNKFVRQAVNYAIDREALTKDVLKGYAYPMDAPVGPDQYGYSREIGPKYKYDPAKARQLLAQAGYANGFEVEFLVPLGQYNKVKDVAEVIGGMLNAVGIHAKLRTQDQDSGFAAIREGKVGMYIFGRGAVVDPSEYLHQYFHTGVTKRLNFSDPRVDAALDAEQASFDPAQRVKLLQKAMSLLMEEAPVAWLYQYQGLQGVSNDFDFKANPGEDVYAWDLKPRSR
ncbi:MAG: ABC transporter substrate-binding protein [Alphaproteobacteria bacterium]